MFKKLISFAFIIFAISACAPSTYTPPSLARQNQYTFIINKNYDKTWSALIDHISSTFFSVENFEKASGLITLNFGEDDPSEYVDCGLFNNGSYAQYLTQNYKNSLVGTINISVKPISKEKTRVRVNAKYKFTVANLQWKFVTGGNDSVSLAKMNTAYGASPTRVCQPSYKAEKEIYNAIQKISSEK